MVPFNATSVWLRLPRPAVVESFSDFTYLSLLESETPPNVQYIRVSNHEQIHTVGNREDPYYTCTHSTLYYE